MNWRSLHFSSSIKTLGCLTALLIVLVAILQPVFWSAREKARQSSCINNVKQIDLALLMYAQDWNETFPPAAKWTALSEKYVPKNDSSNPWHCPGTSSPYSYALNKPVGGLAMTDADALANTIALFEMEADNKNAVGDKRNNSAVNRHNGGSTYGFLDGHVAWRNEYSIKELQWEPARLTEDDKFIKPRNFLPPLHQKAKSGVSPTRKRRQ